MLKYWRMLILFVTLFGAVLAIAYGPPKKGVEIAYVSDNSSASGILSQGMIITSVNAQPVNSIDDWSRLMGELKYTNVDIVADGVKHTFSVNETLGINVLDVQRFNLEFGLDLRGGTRITLTPKENATKDTVDEIVSTLQTRANVYGLTEMRFYSVRGVDGSYFVQIEATGVGREVVEGLLSKQGTFEAKVVKPVQIKDSEGTLQLGQKLYNISLAGNSTVALEGRVFGVNGTFTLDDTDFELTNVTDNQVVFLAKVYTGNDIEMVKTDPQHSGVFPSGGGYQFYFVVMVSEKGAQRFADVTSGIPSFVDLNTGERYLDSRILLYLDGQVVSDLQIGANLGGVVYTTPQVQGSRPVLEEAISEKLNLQSILRSGALPTSLETSSVEVISPTLGSNFFQSAALTALLAEGLVVVVVFLKYRRIKIALPIALIAMSEIIIVLGIAAVNDIWIWSAVLIANFCIIMAAWWKKNEVDVMAWTGALLIPLLGMTAWTIDLPVIGGIIAAIGTGTNDQIIIADEALRGGKTEKKIYTMKEKIKQAFFIVFGAAATTIAAMVPLMSIGVGMVRGFAITTIIGVLIGVLITRPAYAKYVEMSIKD
jgi:preprotein translocase subunit SecD